MTASSAPLFERVLGGDAVAALFADRALVARMLSFEAALARAEADEGVIPRASADAIEAACLDLHRDLDADRLGRDAAVAGTVVVPLVARLREAVGATRRDAAAHVHVGATSQDAIDTAMALATQEALARIDADLARLVASLAALARAHLETPILARTLLQPAAVTSVGFKVAGWAAPLVRARARLARSSGAALQLQLGGPVGTLAALAEHGPAVAERVGASLGLAVPIAAWHTQRDGWVGLGLELALLAGSLGKIGRDVSLLAQGEVGELSEPAGDGRGASSAMPHKRNPVASLKAIAAATRVPQLAATLLQAMPQAHERGLGDWQAELAVWPQLVVATAGSLQALADAAPGFVVDPARMRANIERTDIGKVEIGDDARRAGALAAAWLDDIVPA